MKLSTIIVGAALLAPCNEAIRGRNIAVKGKKTDGAQLNADVQAEGMFVSHAALASHLSESEMSVSAALSILEKHNQTSPELMSALQGRFSVKNLRHGGKQEPTQRQQDAAQAAGSYNSGAWKALNMLNSMVLEATEKMDFEVIRCDGEERTNLQQLKSIGEDIVMFNAMAASAAADKSKAEGDEVKFTGFLNKAEAELKANKKTCNKERKDLKQKIKVVESDLVVMEKVVALTDCGDDTAAGTTLYQCVDTRTNRSWTEVRGKKVEHEMNKFTEPKEMRKMFADNGIFLMQHKQPIAGVPTSGDFISDEPRPGATSEEASSTAKCSLASNPQCPKIQEKFVDLLGEVTESLQELRQMLKNLNLHCKQTLADISAQIENFKTVLMEVNEKLTQATKDWQTYLGQKAQKEGEQTDIQKEHEDTMTGCRVNIENLASEKCALKKIRGELLNMDALPNNITDCEIGLWLEAPCSTTCNGGTQPLTRSLTPGWHGAACPAGKAEQTCAEHRCPVDCVMEEWSAWGSCTALCGGGIKERTRGIKVPSLTKEAVQCEETSETVPCNTGACDGNCELGDWTSWSEKCTKLCGEGEQKRVKPLAKAAFGSGTCPTFYDESRYQVKTCNEINCPMELNLDQPFTCQATVDVVILLDGSGSLGANGFEEVKRGGAALVRRLSGENVRTATMLFSGPGGKNAFFKVLGCYGMMSGKTIFGMKAPEFDANRDCGETWVTHFSDNKSAEDTATAIEALAWPKGATFTGKALAMAEDELSLGRSDAPSVVIVLTDGRPTLPIQMTEFSNRIKEKARLVLVPAGKNVQSKRRQEEFQRWASPRWQDNLVNVAELESLNSTTVIDQILTDMCSNIQVGNQTLEAVIEEELDAANQATR